MKSAIGEKLTRKDHGDVSNQLVRCPYCPPIFHIMLDRVLPLVFWAIFQTWAHGYGLSINY